MTGAGKGIGKAISKALAREGAKLILISRSESDLSNILDELDDVSGRHKIFELDLMNYEETERIIYQIQKETPPDIIVNSVGGSLGVRNALAGYGDWESVWRLNVGITIQINNILIPKMIQKKWGRIINLTTTTTVSQTFTGNPPYISAKAALNAYSKSLSRELAKSGIVVASVAPGAIYTKEDTLQIWQSLHQMSYKNILMIICRKSTGYGRRCGRSCYISMFRIFCILFRINHSG